MYFPAFMSYCFPIITEAEANSPEAEAYYEQAFQYIGIDKIKHAAAMRAIELFERAAETSVVHHRIAAAWSNVALLYLEIGDHLFAEEFERRATLAYEVAANKGYFDAMVEMWIRLEKGRGVKKDKDAALRWCMRIRGQHNAASKLEMYAYRYISGYSMVRNEARAMELFEHAASLGDANAQYELAHFYRIGRVVKLNYQRAAELYTLSAAQNHMLSIYSLGMCHLYGYGVAKDKQRAIELLKRSAEMGCASAHKALALHNQEGAGNLPPSTKEAEEGEEGE